MQIKLVDQHYAIFNYSNNVVGIVEIVPNGSNECKLTWLQHNHRKFFNSVGEALAYVKSINHPDNKPDPIFDYNQRTVAG